MFTKTLVFCDASVSNKEQFAVGAFLILGQETLDSFSNQDQSIMKEYISSQIKYVRIETYKSTLAEIKTFLYAMGKLQPLSNKKITLYTDCQTLVGLHGTRREKLAARNFKKKDGSSLRHGEVYRDVVNLLNNSRVDIVKIKGHAPKREKNNVVDDIFSIVDRLARKKLRALLTNYHLDEKIEVFE